MGLDEIRQKIDVIDTQMKELFLARMDLSAQVIAVKKENGGAVYVPEREKEIQDQFENLLIGADIEFEREGPHIDYSSKAYIPDFSFNSIDLAVEIKLCKTEEKTFIQQINDDILAYKTKFNNLLFIIYDLGVIRDVDTFKQSFEETENVIVHVIKH